MRDPEGDGRSERPQRDALGVIRLEGRRGTVRWFGVLSGTLNVMIGAWHERLAGGSWLLCDGRREIALAPDAGCRFVRGRYLASLLGRARAGDPGRACLADCLRCPGRGSAELARGMMDATMRHAAFRFAEVQADRAGAALIARGLLLQILGGVVQARSESMLEGRCPLRDGDLCRVEAAARLLETRPEADHSIRSVARAAGTNEFKIKRGFREVYDTTVFGYLRRVRMERARALFERGESNVMSVAAAVGYSNPSHFARAFRGQFGINPKSFVLAQRCGSGRAVLAAASPRS